MCYQNHKTNPTLKRDENSQQRPLHFISVGYTSDVLTMSWLDKPAEVDAAVQLPSFTLNDIERNDCSQNYTGGNVIFKLELQKF